MPYTYNPHTHVKIWLSLDQECWLTSTNQLRLIRAIHKNPNDVFSFVYDSRLLSEQSKSNLAVFCARNSVHPHDLNAMIHSSATQFSAEERQLIVMYEDELANINLAGNPAAASDIIRWISPVYLLGTYSDFDREINTSHIADTVEILSPWLINARQDRNSQDQTNPPAPIYNNDIIAIVNEDAARDDICAIQRSMIQRCRGLISFSNQYLQLFSWRSAVHLRQQILDLTQDNISLALHHPAVQLIKLASHPRTLKIELNPLSIILCCLYKDKIYIRGRHEPLKQFTQIAAPLMQTHIRSQEYEVNSWISLHDFLQLYDNNVSDTVSNEVFGEMADVRNYGHDPYAKFHRLTKIPAANLLCNYLFDYILVENAILPLSMYFVQLNASNTPECIPVVRERIAEIARLSDEYISKYAVEAADLIHRLLDLTCRADLTCIENSCKIPAVQLTHLMQPAQLNSQNQRVQLAMNAIVKYKASHSIWFNTGEPLLSRALLLKFYRQDIHEKATLKAVVETTGPGIFTHSVWQRPCILLNSSINPQEYMRVLFLRLMPDEAGRVYLAMCESDDEENLLEIAQADIEEQLRAYQEDKACIIEYNQRFYFKKPGQELRVLPASTQQDLSHYTSDLTECSPTEITNELHRDWHGIELGEPPMQLNRRIKTRFTGTDAVILYQESLYLIVTEAEHTTIHELPPSIHTNQLKREISTFKLDVAEPLKTHQLQLINRATKRPSFIMPKFLSNSYQSYPELNHALRTKSVRQNDLSWLPSGLAKCTARNLEQTTAAKSIQSWLKKHTHKSESEPQCSSVALSRL